MKITLSGVCIGLVIALLSVPALAGEDPGTTRFVSVQTGDDGNPGTQVSPYRTIGGALAALGLEGAAEPWTIAIGPGTYDETVETFPYGEDFCALMRDAGFREVKAFPLTFGIATLYQGDK